MKKNRDHSIKNLKPMLNRNASSLKSYFLFSLVVLATLYSCENKSSQKLVSKSKPNVIIVITDDQGYGDLGHTGNPIIQTPAIDKFSTESVNLTNYHVGTTCAPTRAGLLTGRNCNRNGVWHTIMGASMLNGEEVTLADVFNKNGYETGMFGKWHLGDNHPFLPHDRGFDEAFYHGGGGIGQTPDYWNNDYFDDTYFRNGIPEKKTGYCTDVWFDEAIKFIENKKDDPFLCYLSLNAPHGPLNVPEDYYNRYKSEEINDKQKRFYGMITNIDDNFSKLIQKLDVLGISDNTMVIFTTDNGTAGGGYNAGMRGRKGSEYDGGHRVPFIIKWPEGGLVGGKKLSALTAHVDILPTITKLTGQEFTATKTMDGADISSYLLGKSGAPERFLVTDTQRVPWPIKGKNSCVMQGDWRLVKGNELYNISQDPGQKTNIADQNPEKVEEMNAFYERWWEDVIKETKFSVIELGRDAVDVITCHDARTAGAYPAWNQQQIRKGNPMKLGKFSVDFVKEGKYKFSLRRWPVESGLALGSEILDEIPATLTKNGRINGKAMAFKKAYLKIGEQEYSVPVNNRDQAAIIEVDVKKGETELSAYFDMDDGEQTNAFYVYVEGVK